MAELGSGGGSGYPGALDTDSTIEVDSPSASKTLARADVPNDLAAAIVAIETELGTDPAGSLTDVKTYLQTEHGANGTHDATKVAMLANGALVPAALTVIPTPLLQSAANASQFTIGSPTTSYVHMVHVNSQITINKISIRTGTTISVAGTLDLSLYSEDGQTQHFSVTTATLSAVSTVYTTAVSAVKIDPGNYFFMVNGNSTASVDLLAWDLQNAAPYTATEGLHSDVSGEPMLVGTYAITSGTPPSTITLASITEVGSVDGVIFRLDN